jgi:N-acetylneuraminic acid mutarotase
MSFFATLRRTFLSRPGRPRLPFAALVVLTPLLVAAGSAREPEWRSAPPLPVPRTEVAATAHGGSIAVAGGYLADGQTSARVDRFTPATQRWRRLPNLPQAVNHAMAAAWNGRLYVAGGYLGRGRPSRGAFVLSNGRWRALPRLPSARAAGGAAVVNGRLYVVGGVGTTGLARTAYVLDLRSPRRWRSTPAPTRREHLAVTAARGRIYAVAGRLAGIDTNLDVVESWAPGERRWRRHAPVPGKRGGTAAAAVGRYVVSVGGEEPRGTIASVFRFDSDANTWDALPPLPTPRHGLGAATVAGVVYAIGGGPVPGLTVSGANEFLAGAGADS